MGSDGGAAERIEVDEERDSDPPTSSPDEQVLEMFARLDAALDAKQDSFDALDRKSLELRRILRSRRVDSRPKLHAVLGSVPPPAPALEE